MATSVRQFLVVHEPVDRRVDLIARGSEPMPEVKAAINEEEHKPNEEDVTEEIDECACSGPRDDSCTRFSRRRIALIRLTSAIDEQKHQSNTQNPQQPRHILFTSSFTLPHLAVASTLGRMGIVALWAGKLVLIAIRLSGRRGSALPGLVAERLDPHFLVKYLSQLRRGVVIITGTNGKTTTTKMVSHIVSRRMRVLTNPTGSNLTRGIIASVVENATVLGKLHFDIAVMELDEAYAVTLAQSIAPRGVVVLNIMRDQLDRFGEIDHTARLLAKVVEKAKEFVILNADDPRVYGLREGVSADTAYFGVSAALRDRFANDDELHSTITAARDDVIMDAELEAYDEPKLQLGVRNEQLDVVVKSRGNHNALNAVAAALTAHRLGCSIEDIRRGLEAVGPAFGRGEEIVVDGKRVLLQLVKNPGSFRHVLLSNENAQAAHTLIAINDAHADGRDVSWLWDVDFAGFMGESVSTTGTRAVDMAVRLRYDEIPAASALPDLRQGLEQALQKVSREETLLVYATYTAMLSLRHLLSKVATVAKV